MGAAKSEHRGLGPGGRCTSEERRHCRAGGGGGGAHIRRAELKHAYIELWGEHTALSLLLEELVALPIDAQISKARTMCAGD